VSQDRAAAHDGVTLGESMLTRGPVAVLSEIAVIAGCAECVWVAALADVSKGTITTVSTNSMASGIRRMMFSLA
jgi:hypothetical protein